MDERETPTIEWIKKNLDRIASIDKKNRVFGAYGHQYKSYHLSNNEIESFEAELGVRLPEDYRQFLQEIGYGAGPYYGLNSPQVIVCDLNDTAIYGEHHGLKDPSRPFPFNREDARECFKIMSEWREAIFTADSPTNGCIPLCDEGCGYHTFLVTAGELTDSLWSHNIDSEDEDNPCLKHWNLAPRPPGILGLRKPPDVPPWHPTLSPFPTYLEWYNAWRDRCPDEPAWHQALSTLPTFLEWYNAWSDQCLADFEELKNQDK